MPKTCRKGTTGGKGNLGMFIERDPKVCAAGIASAQPEETVAGALQHYLLKDEVDSLIGDAIIPAPPPRPLPPLRRPIPLDKRFGGPFSDVASIINPPLPTKLEKLAEDIQETSYASYWKKVVGKSKDPVPMFPEGYDINGTTYGRKILSDVRLYDVIMPRVPLPDLAPRRRAAYRTDRNYCQPAYRPDVTYGYRSHSDRRGILMKCVLTDPNKEDGKESCAVINSVQSRFLESHQPLMSTVMTPNNNIYKVPVGHSFGKLSMPDNVAECLTLCEINKDREKFKECLKHLNSVRQILRGRRLLPSYFRLLYLELKHYDTDHSGWLPKNVVYTHCLNKNIRVSPHLIEPLLGMWQAFDGENIDYQKFVRNVLNVKERVPNIPRVLDMQTDCLEFRTTYGEMTKPGQIYEGGSFRAGHPSGRYLDRDFPVTPDKYCSAHKVCLYDESDMKSCLNPSVLTQMHVSHRDMYEKREPEVVRRVFEAAGEKFTDESFNAIWERAKKGHSLGWVCYETFRRALMEVNPDTAQ